MSTRVPVREFSYACAHVVGYGMRVRLERTIFELDALEVGRLMRAEKWLPYHQK